ncbi:unnamed protein product, partial [Nesidiocoris tenuis]
MFCRHQLHNVQSPHPPYCRQGVVPDVPCRPQGEDWNQPRTILQPIIFLRNRRLVI